jgi:hypothetical protein
VCPSDVVSAVWVSYEGVWGSRWSGLVWKMRGCSKRLATNVCPIGNVSYVLSRHVSKADSIGFSPSMLKRTKGYSIVPSCDDMRLTITRRAALFPEVRFDASHNHHHSNTLYIRLCLVAFTIQLPRHLALLRHVIQNLFSRLHSIDSSRNSAVGCCVYNCFPNFQL